MGSGTDTYVVVSGPAVAGNGLARGVISNGVRKRWTWGNAFTIEMDDNELAWPFLIFLDDKQCSVPAVW